jgi:molybdopterin-guanine dinucleotide biosynthesis protein B/molybdopterin-guanine dinucleotide biosynthesis protein
MQNPHIETKSSLTFPDVTGVILAGGRSSRMGRDKAVLELGGVSFFERILSVFRSLFPHVLIAGDRPDLAAPDLPCFPDRYPGSALGGLYTGLLAAETPYVFVAACDMPCPDPELIRAILAQRSGYDVVVPQTPAGLEPLFALYGKACLEPMRTLLEAKNYRVYDFYPEVRVRYLESAALPPGWERALINVNTPEELQRFKEELNMKPAIVSVVAKSGTGKTTLLEKLIAELKRRGWRVGAVKHDAHRFDIDREGKDSWRLTQAGADTMLITSPEKIAMVKRHGDGQEPPLAETIARYFGDVDIVLTEGFKKSAMPKIEVHRAERSATLLCRGEEHDSTLIAVASDERLELDVPVYDLNDAAGLCDFIEARFLR